ncbi:hypothetical protein VC83_07836 [Pseudogymnoascus destructans]|uniref:Secreted protein n=1 Tax=Pseudogymnoascus destructans TaxID=655981 RepID=A0A177A2Y6_9PEZI|nr:uncharacterized protein VC83_07836 [Pseudogymnoascus destructans]OAF55832.1 hypothetical protein VC83_07836 [Pseudogymnoascus destructans]
MNEWGLAWVLWGLRVAADGPLVGGVWEWVVPMGNSSINSLDPRIMQEMEITSSHSTHSRSRNRPSRLVSSRLVLPPLAHLVFIDARPSAASLFIASKRFFVRPFFFIRITT